MTKKKPQPVPTKDSFVNFATRTGIGTDNMSSANSYGFNPISRMRLLIEWMYRGSWICGVGVDCVADDMTREGIEVQGMDANDADKLQTCLQTRQVAQSLNEVAKWARLYGGALGVIGIKGQDYSTPLRLETVGKDQFEGITVMDRWMVNPNLMTGITQPGPDFGLPPSYDVVARSFQFPFPQDKVHHTRCIRMEGLSLPFWQKQSENMWGISVLERVYDRLTAFDSVTQGAAQLAYRSYLRTLKIENLREVIAAGGKQYESLLAQIELIRRYQANEGVTLLDASDDFATHSYTFAGLSDLLNSMGDQISGALQVPIARLFGQSPGGMNSTGDHELRTYYDNVKRLQERWFRRPLDVVLRVAAASEGIQIPEGFKYDYVSLWQMTDKEKAEKNASDVSAIKTADDMGLPKRVIMQELKKAGQSTGYWTSITEEDIKEAEKEDAEMPSAAELLMQGKEANGEDENDKGEAHAHAIEETQDADPDDDNPYTISQTHIFKLQVPDRNGVWKTLPDTRFGNKLRAKEYGDKYYARRYRIQELLKTSDADTFSTEHYIGWVQRIKESDIAVVTVCEYDRKNLKVGRTIEEYETALAGAAASVRRAVKKAEDAHL